MKATCAWCGKDLGYERERHRDAEPDSCGSRDCERGLRNMFGVEEERIREEAERDNFDRYRH